MEEQILSKIRSPMLGSNHDHPVPVGVTMKVMTERGYVVEVTVLEIVRGKDAQERIIAKGVSDKLPKAGFEYVLARIKFGYFRKAKGMNDPDHAYRIAGSNFSATSADGKMEYETPSVLRQPQPQLIDTLTPPGEFREGWIVLQVPEDEKEPLLAFHREYAHSNYVLLHQWRPVWFKLYNFDPMCINTSCTDCF
jgi:hypothetical protein